MEKLESFGLSVWLEIKNPYKKWILRPCCEKFLIRVGYSG